MASRVMQLLFGIALASPAGAVGSELADPTRPPAVASAPLPIEAAEAPSQWMLSMVKISEKIRTAILNGALVREDDRVGSARVARILPSGIELEERGRTLVVGFGARPVKSITGKNAPAVNGRFEGSIQP